MKSLLISACLLGVSCRFDGKAKEYLSKEVLAHLKERYHLVPVCPEIYGGLPTPRAGSERQGDKVVMTDGRIVTENYKRGAEAALLLARSFECEVALLKERSPSCGHGMIYDGTFSRTLKNGDGVTAELLSLNGIRVFGESDVEKLL